MVKNHTRILPDGDGIEFGRNVCSNHYAMVYSDVLEIIEDYCMVTGIRNINC